MFLKYARYRMKYIYYPEYELEYTNLLNRKSTEEHILNIKLLMFLCDQIILPPSHLLYTSNENVLSLIKNLRSFFSAGKIVTTHYQNGIEDYFASRIERIQNPILKCNKEIQAQLIMEKLLFDKNIEHNKSNEKIQLSLFDARLKELIQLSTIHKNPSRILLEEMDRLSDKTGEAVHSNQFSNIVTDMFKNHTIKKGQQAYFMNLMSNAYYYSGTYTMNTLVSYNSYFEKINLHNSLLNTNENATNLIVNPYFLKNLFQIIGIDMQDIYQLDVCDYEEIMSHKYWSQFIEVFNNIYSNAENLEELLKQRTTLVAIYKNRKDNLFKAIDILNDLLLGILLTPVHPAIGIGIPLVISSLRSFFPPVKKFESFLKMNTSGKIIDRIIRNNDPLYEFSYRLNAAVNTLR